MTLRYFDGSYRPGGRFHDSLPVKPNFNSNGDSFLKGLRAFLSRRGTFFLIALLGNAYNAHMNAAIFYQEAGHRDDMFRLVAVFGFTSAMLLSVVFLVSGFLTFGSSSAGVILNSYAPTDRLAAVARALFGLSVICSYPVLFQGFKAAVRTILIPFTVKDSIGLDQAITLIPIAVITLTAVLVKDAGIVNAVSGAVTGSSLIYLFPTIMYLMSPLPTIKNPIETVAICGLLVFGGLMFVLGLYTSFSTGPKQILAIKRVLSMHSLSQIVGRRLKKVVSWRWLQDASCCGRTVSPVSGSYSPA